MSAVALALYLLPAITLPHAHLIEHGLVPPSAITVHLNAVSPAGSLRRLGSGDDDPEDPDDGPVRFGWRVTGGFSLGIFCAAAVMFNVIALNGPVSAAAVGMLLAAVGGVFAGYHLGLSPSTGAKVAIIVLAILGPALIAGGFFAAAAGVFRFNPPLVEAGGRPVEQ